MIKGAKVFLPADPDSGKHLGYTRLMCGILNRAYLDYMWSSDLEVKLDALYFLSSDGWLYCDALKIDSHPLQPVCDGVKMRKSKW